VNNRSIPSTHAQRKITDLSDSHSFTPHPSLSPYSQTELQRDRQNYRETNTIAVRGLEEPFFQWCCCVSFLVVAEIVLGDTYLPYQLCRCVFFFVAAENSFWLHRSVFWLWREIVLGFTSLPTIPVVPLCQFFGCGGK
jgi:hypothetical protein